MISNAVFDKYLSTAVGLPADAAERVSTLDASKSFIVKAPAGAGKTELLTQRYLTLLSAVENPEDILAITFTNKAGAEMKSRIVKALEFAKHGDEPSMGHTWLTWKIAKAALERSELKGWDVLDNPGRLRIRTIDAFYGSLVRSAPIASLTGGNNSITDDAEHCYRMAAQDLLGDIESGDMWVDTLEAVLRHCDNRFDRAEDLFVNLLSQREHWLPLVLEAAQVSDLRENLEETLSELFKAQVYGVQSSLNPYWHTIKDMAGVAAGNLEPDSKLAALAQVADAESLYFMPADALEALRSFLLTGEGSIRKSATAAIGFPAPSKVKDADEKARLTAAKKTFSELLQDISADEAASNGLVKLSTLPPSSYTDKEWFLLENLLSLLPVLAAKLVLVFQREGVVDHSEIAAGALRVLGEAETPSDLALILDNQLQHILIDEFQDTNNLQMEGLKRITAGWERGDGRTLFLVGDAQQSIYSFRGSNVGLFVDVEESGVGDLEITPAALTVNFRSSSSIIDWVNNTFAGVFPAEQDANLGAIPFSPANVGNTDLKGDGVRTVLFAGDTPEARRHEGQYIADQIGKLREANPADTVGILVRSRTHLVDVITSLRNRNIPYQAIEIDALKDRASIRDLAALTRAICHQGDRTAWLSVLRGPMVGLPLEDLELVAKASEKKSILAALQSAALLAMVGDDVAARIKRFTDVFGKTEWLRERKPLHMLVEGAWIALNGPVMLQDPTDLLNAQAFFDILKKFTFGGFDLARFDRALDKLYALPYSAEPNAVQIMTMHKSKGLEFDHVFIPACDRLSRGDDAALLVWDRVTEGGIEKPLLATNPEIGGNENRAYNFIRSQDSDRKKLESQRIIYVGVTRAKKTLMVSGSVNCDDAGNAKAPTSNSFFGALWPMVEEVTEVIAAAPVDERGLSVKSERPSFQYIAADAELPTLERGEALGSYRGRIELNKDELPDLAWKVDYRRLIGTAVHRVLAQITVEGIDGYMAKIDLHKTGWNSQLLQLGVPSYYCPTALKDMHQWISAITANKTGMWLLDNSHEESACELELCTFDDGRVVTNIIDRSFIADGVRWVVDYKLGEKSKVELDADYSARMINDHTDQLHRYADLASQLGDHPVKCAIYCVAEQQLIEVPYSKEAKAA